jgi:hypothetical protein
MRTVWTRAVLPLVRGTRPARLRPHETAAKNLLRPLPDSVRLDCHIALTELQFSRRPASAGFLFSRSLDFLQTVVNKDGRLRNRIGPQRVCLNICNSASAIQLSGYFFYYHNLLALERIARDDVCEEHGGVELPAECFDQQAFVWHVTRHGLFSCLPPVSRRSPPKP